MKEKIKEAIRRSREPLLAKPPSRRNSPLERLLLRHLGVRARIVKDRDAERGVEVSEPGVGASRAKGKS